MKELVTGLTEKRTPEGICVLRVHYTADPERRAPEWKERERRKYTSESAWQAEQEIVFGAGGGERLFAEILTRYAHKIIIDPEPSGFKPSPPLGLFRRVRFRKSEPHCSACRDLWATRFIQIPQFSTRTKRRTTVLSMLLHLCAKKRASTTWRRRQKTTNFLEWSAFFSTG